MEVAAGGDGLEAWVAATLGGAVTGWRRLSAGNSRTTFAADVAVEGGPLEVVVRAESGGGPSSGTELTLEREATVYRALEGSGVGLPRLYDFDPVRQAMVLERVAGSTAWTEDALRGCLAELSKLHALDAERLELPGLARSAAGDLELWARIAAERVTPASPFVDFAVPFLREAFPGEPERLVLCHGDAGAGNVVVDASGSAALLDWEFAHLGDPLDDLAWVTLRAGLFGVELGDFAGRVRDTYAGAALDGERLAYWQAVVVLRNLVSCLVVVSNPVPGRDRLLHLMLVPPLDRLLVGLLARLAGVELEPATPPTGPADLPGGDVLRTVAEQLGDLAQALGDEEQRVWAKRMRLLLAQLAETWTLAPDIARADAAEGPPATDVPSRLAQLARTADRRLALFPRSAAIAGLRPASF